VTLAIVVPVKSPQRAKHRLSPLLSEEERFLLASAMARDVFRAVRPLSQYSRLVVSDDSTVLAEAANFGLEPLKDRVGQGQSVAVQQGFSLAWERGCTVGLTIPGDVPGVTTAEVTELAAYRPEIEVLLVTDRERIGTNGLRLTPPHAITLRFGEDSFQLHRAEATRANRSFAVKHLIGLEHDLDRPEDVTAFLELGRETETLSLLHELKVADRVLAATLRRD
jgi:2-phospho-L-lactate/phosphoenolpyruvate guanylyltransferase